MARALAYLILRESNLRTLFSLVQGRLLQLPGEIVEIAVRADRAGLPDSASVMARGRLNPIHRE